MSFVGKIYCKCPVIKEAFSPNKRQGRLKHPVKTSY